MIGEERRSRTPRLYQLDKYERQNIYFSKRIGVWLLNYYYITDFKRRWTKHK